MTGLITAIATVIYVIIVFITACYASHQLREMQKSRQEESVRRILEYVHGPHLRQARWVISEARDTLGPLLEKIPGEPNAFEDWCKNNGWKLLRERIEVLLKELTGLEVKFGDLEGSLKVVDYVAFLVLHDYVERDPVATTFMKKVFERYWNTFEPYITRYRRPLSPKRPLYCIDLETLAKQLESEGTMTNEERDRVYYRALYHLVTHWAGYLATVGLLVTLGTVISTSNVIRPRYYCLAAIAVTFVGSVLFLVRINTFASIVNDPQMIPAPEVAKTDWKWGEKVILKSPWNLVTGGIVALVIAIADIAALFHWW